MTTDSSFVSADPSRRRAIDFVGQYEVRKDGTEMELKIVGRLVENRYSGDVAGENVGSELNPVP